MTTSNSSADGVTLNQDTLQDAQEAERLLRERMGSVRGVDKSRLPLFCYIFETVRRDRALLKLAREVRDSVMRMTDAQADAIGLRKDAIEELVGVIHMGIAADRANLNWSYGKFGDCSWTHGQRLLDAQQVGRALRGLPPDQPVMRGDWGMADEG